MHQPSFPNPPSQLDTLEEIARRQSACRIERRSYASSPPLLL